MSKRTVQQIVDVPVPQILEEIVALVAGEVVLQRSDRRQATARVDVHLSGSRSWMVRYHRSRRRLLK